MDYTYLLEDNAVWIDDTRDITILYLLCYNVNTDCKYPFLQFMMDKIPFCDNLVKEELTLPHIMINNNDDYDISVIIKKHINNKSIEIKGVIKICHKYYALINVSTCNTKIKLNRNSPYWFVLPSEIICVKNVCNIPIDESVVSLFTENPEIGLLTNPKTHLYYILPDSVYTMGTIKSVEFNSIFGNQKTKPYNNCGEYYFFYRSFKDVSKIENDVGINRYALFVEGNLYLEETNECQLTNTIIEEEYPESCIIICYLKEHNIMPDILVKEDNYSCCISYHTNISEYKNI